MAENGNEGFGLIEGFLGEILKVILKSGEDVRGFLLKPGETQVIFFGTEKPNKPFKMVPKTRKELANQLKTGAGLALRAEFAQIGYWQIVFNGDAHALVMYFRPTRIGEEIMVRVLLRDDPTLPEGVALRG